MRMNGAYGLSSLNYMSTQVSNRKEGSPLINIKLENIRLEQFLVYVFARACWFLKQSGSYNQGNFDGLIDKSFRIF
jgi:hypothetical protein